MIRLELRIELNCKHVCYPTGGAECLEAFADASKVWGNQVSPLSRRRTNRNTDAKLEIKFTGLVRQQLKSK